MKPTPLCEADINEDDVQAVASTLRDGWISSAAPVVEAFEDAFLAQIHAWGACPDLGCVATQSGTSALWMCLHLLDLPQGSEVLCPATSFVASIHPFLYQKHRLRLVDVDPLTFAPTLEAYQSAKTPETKVVLVTHLYGLAMPELLKLRQWCDAEGLILIEDAAESLGTLVEGKPVGTNGHYGFYSFNVNKTLTTASGGILVSEDHALLAKVKHQSTQAKCYSSGELFHDALGFNLRMNALHASLGISQLKRLSSFLDAKSRIADGYFQAFKGHPALNFVHHHNPPYQNAFENITPSYWLNLLYLESHDKRKALQGALHAQGVQVRPVFMPFTAFDYVHPFLVEASLQDPCSQFKNAYALWKRGINLPSSPHLSEDDQARVIAYTIRSSI